ncbi:MAG: 50S ribosomal protein L13 [Patescibacteria group bacterium]|nr:50S ribosomal protein L13 [Patescibacteria group bacterium]
MTNRKIYKIDATNQAIGRIATQIVSFLRGKNNPDFEFNQDKGGFVEVENIANVKFTGKKIEQKKYYRHSGYPGGLKEKKMKEIFDKNPGEILKMAVYKMLPKNRLRNDMIKRLKIK